MDDGGDQQWGRLTAVVVDDEGSWWRWPCVLGSSIKLNAFIGPGPIFKYVLGGVLPASQRILLYPQKWPFSPHIQSSGTHTLSSYLTSLTISTQYSFTFLNHSSLTSLT